MSYEDGWAALNLDMPARIPHTEMSADWYHGPLVEAVTGIPIRPDMPFSEREKACAPFVAAWNYDIHMTCWFDDASGIRRVMPRNGVIVCVPRGPATPHLPEHTENPLA
jgi:hypothetical protein